MNDSKNNKKPLLSVIIPVYNERRNIEELISRVHRADVDKEIIVVDDCSMDGTWQILDEVIRKAYPEIRIFRHAENRGKGAAIRTGIPHARGEVTLIQDADLEYDPKDYKMLMRPFVRSNAQVVYGSRFLRVNRWLFMWHWFLNRFFGKQYEIRYLHHFLGIQMLNLLANLLYGAKITDEATCYKAIKTEVLQDLKLKCTGFEFCPEVTARIRKRGIPIKEVLITYHPRSKQEGKKLNWTHGFEAIWTLIKYRFVD